MTTIPITAGQWRRSAWGLTGIVLRPWPPPHFPAATLPALATESRQVPLFREALRPASRLLAEAAGWRIRPRPAALLRRRRGAAAIFSAPL